MIKIEKIDSKFFLSFKGNNFLDILEIVKGEGLRYDEKLGKWLGNKKIFYNVINQLKEIEYVEVSNEILEEIKPKPRIEFERRECKKELMLSEPLGKYQLEDIETMLSTNGIINGIDVGLGKTIETITVLNHLYNNKEIDKIFIVTFAQAVYNWKKEFLKFSSFFKDEDIIIANKELRNPFIDNPKIIICSYNTLVLIQKFFKKDFTKLSRKSNLPLNTWGNKRAIILDESHAIKSNSLRTKACLTIKDYFEFRYLLSATPYPNNAAELYFQLEMIDENIIYKNHEPFLRSIANIGNQYGDYAINYFYPDKVKEFVEKISPYIFRRYKKDCLPNLPEQYIKKIYVELNEKQRKIYQMIIMKTLQSLKEKKGILLVKDVLNKFPYLILTLSDPSIVKGRLIEDKNILFNTDEIDKLLDNWNFEDNSKLEACSDIIENHEGEKIIIWSSHPVTIEKLAKYYENRLPFIIHGNSQGKEDKEAHRDRILEEFKASKDRNLIIMNPGIMGTAINIKESTVSIFFDRTYDIKEWLQALGRNHRGNSTKEVFVYVLINDNTLENRQDAILEGKDMLDKNLLKYDSLPKEEWLKIFGGKIE